MAESHCDNGPDSYFWSPKEENSKSSDPSSNEDHSSDASKVLESPKPLAFTIEFGEQKPVDSTRMKNMLEKYQNRHRRNKSLSKIQSPKELSVQPINKPLSVNFPRKTDYHSEGYFSSDQEEKCDASFLRQLKMLGLKSNVMNTVKQPILKNEMTLPLQNTTSQRLSDTTKRQQFDLNMLSTPENLKDISSPELDILTPLDPTPNMTKSMPECEFVKSPHFSKKEVKSMFISFHDTSNNQEMMSSPKINKRFPKSLSKNSIHNNLVKNHEPLSPRVEPFKTTSTTPNETYAINDLEQNSDSVSEAGTYTLDADNYTEEQKARMSIDREINLNSESSAHRTQTFVESTLQYVTNNVRFETTELYDSNEASCIVEDASGELVQHIQPEINYVQTTIEYISPGPTTKSKKILSPKDSLVQISVEPNNSSEMQSNLVRKNVALNNVDSFRNNQKNTNKILFASKKAKNAVGLSQEIDQGSFTSVTTCGVFNRENKASNVSTEMSPEKKAISRRGSLTKTDCFYDNSVSSVRGEIKQITSEVIVKKPPMSPTKIPSPVQSLSRPRSRASIDLSDSSIETDCYLKDTHNAISSFQARLGLETNYDQRKIPQNILKSQTKHVRHNSFDSRNTHLINNKLENFQTKVFQPNIDQTFNAHNQFNMQKNVFTPSVATRSPTHKLYNSPNNSPIKRSSSFSVKHNMSNSYAGCTDFGFKKNSPISSPRIPKDSNLARRSPTLNHDNTKVHRSSSTASIKKHLNPFRKHNTSSPENRQNSSNESINQHKINSAIPVSESSSEDEIANNLCIKNHDANSSLTNTRHNRAFSLRRARLDVENASKCPNTPEMRRKFISSNNAIGAEEKKQPTPRSSSIEARKSATEVKSRYLNISKPTSTPKPTTKFVNDAHSTSVYNTSSKNVAAPNKTPVTNTKPTATPLKNPVLARTDSGRFSMRTPKPKPIVQVKNSNSKKGNRSNSTLTSREVEFQNWKRRKSYDPMKAAAEGKKRAEQNKKLQTSAALTMTQSYTQASQDCDSSPSHSSSVHRSQSFHGTGGLDLYISSEDELTLSQDEHDGITPPAPTPDLASPDKVSTQRGWYHSNVRY